MPTRPILHVPQHVLPTCNHSIRTLTLSHFLHSHSGSAPESAKDALMVAIEAGALAMLRSESSDEAPWESRMGGFVAAKVRSGG